jgi:hypothetical protein
MRARPRACGASRGHRPPLILAALVVAGGCETISHDLSAIAEGLVPTSWGEVGRMALDPHNPDRRREGTLRLASAPFGSEETYVRLYREYVANDENTLVRAAAIRALARHGAPDDALLIARHLADENVQVRWEAAKGLQRLHSPAVVPALLAVLRDDEESSVREAAATALGQYAEERVFQALVAALDARELEVNVAAQRSLRTLTGVDLGSDRNDWRAWYREAGATAFAGAEDFLYPTYQRSPTFLERLVFWNPRAYEEPAPPAGFPSHTARRTYEDAPAPAAPPSGEPASGATEPAVPPQGAERP